MSTQREEIVVRAGFDNTALASGLRNTESTLIDFAKRIGSVFAIGSIINFEKGILDMAKSIKETSERLAVSTDEVQALSYAAMQSGVGMEKVAASFDKLSKAKEAIMQAKEGSGDLYDAFTRIGISLDEIYKLSPDELFDRMAASISKTGVNSENTAALMTIFGRAAGQLIPMLSKLKDLKESAPLITSEEIKNLSEADSLLETIWLKAKVAAAQITVNLSRLFKRDLDNELPTSGFYENGKLVKSLEETPVAPPTVADGKIKGLDLKKNFVNPLLEFFEEFKKNLALVEKIHSLELDYTKTQTHIGKLERERQNALEQGTFPELEQIVGRSYVNLIQRQYGPGGRYDLGGRATGYFRNTEAMELYRLTHGATQYDREMGNKEEVKWDINRIKELRESLSNQGLLPQDETLASIKENTEQAQVSLQEIVTKLGIEGIVIKSN